MLPGLETISMRRRRLGLTQSQLARMAGVSQGYIAKIEGGTVDPSYHNVGAILEALDSFEGGEEVQASEVMNRDLVSVDTATSIQSAVEVMRRNGFSQLPVTRDNHIVGSIEEMRIMEHLSAEDSRPVDTMVGDIMQESFPRVDGGRR